MARQARRSLDKVRRRLLAPSISLLDHSTADLVIAVDCLKRVESGLGSGQRRAPGWRNELAVEMARLRRDLKDVNELLVGAGKFYTGWARFASSHPDDAPANYTVRGAPGAVIPIRSGGTVVHG
jgi:hypothetical protein